MPGRLVFATTADGASFLRWSGFVLPAMAYKHTANQAPAAVNATATLTVANLKAGIITSTSAAATDMTLPTGADTQAGFSGTYNNFTFEWSVINTGPSLVGVLAATDHTIVGSGLLPLVRRTICLTADSEQHLCYLPPELVVPFSTVPG